MILSTISARIAGRVALLTTLLAMLTLAPPVVLAQPAVQRPVTASSSACCAITTIDLRTGHVRAQAKEPERDFEFIVADRAVLARLKVGQPIFANFKTNRVSVDGLDACCSIAAAPPINEARAPSSSSSKPEGKQTTKPTTGSFNSMKVDVSPIHPIEDTTSTTTAIRGVMSANDENARGQTDPHLVPKAHVFIAMPPHTVGRSRRLTDDPAINEYVKTAVSALKGFTINTALLAGHKYMINSCLGVKVNAGEFALTVPDPDLRVVSDGLVLTFSIAHVAMSAFSVRLRPDPTDIVQPCHFGGTIGIGGAADDVRYELHFDPILDLEQCKIGSMGKLHQVWRIGTLRLSPLPAEVSSLAGNMIEDSLTAFANVDIVDRIAAALNAAANAQCHK